MSPVDRAGPVSEISPYFESFVKFARAGWLGSRDLGMGAGNFAIRTLHPGYRDEF